MSGELNWTKEDDLEIVALSNTSSSNLVLRANVLRPEMSYVIRMRHESDDYKGLTEYSFTTSTPPQGGNCSVGPSEGIAYETLFTFRCSGWKTNHFPLLYVFAYHDPYTLLKANALSSGGRRVFSQVGSRRLHGELPSKSIFQRHRFAWAQIDNHKLIKVFAIFCCLTSICPEVILDIFSTNARINVWTEGGGGGTGKGAAFEFFLQFFGQIPDPWDWKIVQI